MALVKAELAVSHILGAPRSTIHTIELYLDYTCPFCGKLFKQFYNNIVPILENEYPGKFQAIFKHQVQPWHPASALTHEIALAVAKIAPEKFWEFSAALFERQKEYFDGAVANESRNETYKRLSQLAEEKTGHPAKEFYNTLAISVEKPEYNDGNQITSDLKLHIKSARLSGIHFSPTIVFNGNRDDSISSGWTVEQWRGWLKAKVN